jgi:hypothetical protein
MLMTALITLDAYFSYNCLLAKHDSHDLVLPEDSSFFTGDWKQSLFYRADVSSSVKTLGLFLLTIQSIFTFSCLFLFSGLMVRI